MSRISLVPVLAVLTAGLCNAQTFLDLTSVTPGNAGSFTGLLGGSIVTGAITTQSAGFILSATVNNPDYTLSTVDNSSRQYSYGTVYSPSIAFTDRVGYVSSFGSVNTATITINFSGPVTNPVFHVANLDGMEYDFSPTAGLAGLQLLSGNGDGVEGLVVAGNVVKDANNSTLAGVDPNQPPPMAGPRSAYGSVKLLGTFSTLIINVRNPTAQGDGGSFTLSVDEFPWYFFF